MMRGLLALLVIAPACAPGIRVANVLQFQQVNRNEVPNNGFGAGIYGLGNYYKPVNAFVEGRLSFSGDVDGPHYDFLAEGSFGDRQTGSREVTSVSVHVGATALLLDWLHCYAGIGWGGYDEKVEQFDETRILSSSGYYSVQGDSDDRLSGTGGLIFTPWQKLVLQVGYESWFNGPSFGIGFTF